MDEQLTRALEAVRAYVVGMEPLSDTLQIVASTAQFALHADAVGVTLEYPDGRPRTAVSTSKIANAVDEAQYEADSGPCVDSYRQHTRFIVDDTRTETRWPEFSVAAQEHGVRSSMSLPMMVAGEGIGALNLYSATPRQFTDEDADDADCFAGQAAVALANAQAYWSQAELAANLEKAMQSRATIEQAKGVIMSSKGCDPDEAFTILRDQSQHENRKLREVAAEIVARQTRSTGP